MAKGHVERLKSGGLRAKVYAGTDPITKRQIYLTGPTRADETRAQQDVGKLLRDAEAQRNPDRSATVSFLLTRWLEVADLELTTRDTHLGYIRRTINPAIGDVNLRKLEARVDILDRLYAHLRTCGKLCGGKLTVDHRTSWPHECRVVKHHKRREHDCAEAGCRVIECRPHVCKPAAQATIRQINAILSAALGYAIAWGWIERNPAKVAHIPKQKRRKRARPPEAEQVAALINLAWERDPEYGLFLWLASTTGARRGELVGLPWSSVDLTRGQLLIQPNYVVRGGQKKLKNTKTDDDEPRPVALDTITVNLLAEHHEQRRAALEAAGVEMPAESFVFSPDPAGVKPWNPDTMSHRHKRLADALGITTPLKNLRHFSATQLLASGVDLRTAAGRLGHADGGATTLRFYADYNRPADQRAAETIAQGLTAMRDRAALDSPSVRVDPPKPLSPYQRIAAELRDSIADGTYPPGAAIPTVKALAARYDVAFGTAQRAIATLVAEGLLTSGRGLRTTVVWAA